MKDHQKCCLISLTVSLIASFVNLFFIPENPDPLSLLISRIIIVIIVLCYLLLYRYVVKLEIELEKYREKENNPESENTYDR